MYYYKIFLIFFQFLSIYAYININIDATGLYLPYSIGVLGYIKKNIKIKNYNITGISGGAIASIIYHYEDDLENHDKLWDKLIGTNKKYSLTFDKNLEELKKQIKKNMLKNYNYITDDVPISVIVTELNFLYAKNIKITNFDNLEDLIDYSLCSSYIPFISGNSFTKEYKNKYYIDGMIFKNKTQFICNNDNNNLLYIDRNIWGRKFDNKKYKFIDKDISRELFEYGWKDTEKNHNKIIDKLFRMY